MDRPHPAYEGDDPFLFVSYSHADEGVVYPEIRWLQDQNVNVWFDEGISGASRWRDAIAGRIAGCSLFVLYLSENSASSTVCREELEFAIDQGREILTIAVDDAQPAEGIRLAISNRQAIHRHELDAGEYQRKLTGAIGSTLPTAADSAAEPIPFVQPRTGRRWALPVVSGVLGVVLGGALAVLLGLGGPGDDPVAGYRFDLYFDDPVLRHPENEIGSLVSGFGLNNAGTALVFVGEDDAGRFLFHRDLQSGETRRFDETEGAMAPMFSPDDRSIAYFVGNTLFRIPVDGGRPQRLATTENPVAARWAKLATIAVVHGDGRRFSLVPAEGGATLDIEWSRGGPPHLLPDEARVVASRANQLYVLDLASRDTRQLGMEGVYPIVREGILFARTPSGLTAAAFDETSATLTSPVVTLPMRLRDVYQPGLWAVGENGLLIHAPVDPDSRPVFSRVGSAPATPVASDVAPGLHGTFSVSPDGRLVAWSEIRLESRTSLILVTDISTGATRRLPARPGLIAELFWEPDGSGLYAVFLDSGAVASIYHALDTDRFVDQTAELGGAMTSISADARLVTVMGGGGIHAVDRSTGERVLITDGGDDWGASVAPDGSGVAFVSPRSGSYEVFFRPLPVSDRLIQVSRGAGSEEPRWNQDGSRLYFRRGGRVMVADRIGPAEFAEPRVFFEGSFVNMAGRSFDILPGETEALVVLQQPGVSRSLKVETNWLARVRQLIDEAR